MEDGLSSLLPVSLICPFKQSSSCCIIIF